MEADQRSWGAAESDREGPLPQPGCPTILIIPGLAHPSGTGQGAPGRWCSGKGPCRVRTTVVSWALAHPHLQGWMSPLKIEGGGLGFLTRLPGPALLSSVAVEGVGVLYSQLCGPSMF